MYAERFGLNTPVFTSGIAQDEHVYRGEAQQSVHTKLAVSLTRSDSVAVLYGAPGTGKTTLAASMLRATATKLALGCLAHGPLTPHELLEQLLTEFGFAPYKNSRTERLAIWRQHLAEMSATGTCVCILIEHADQLSTDVLAELESLTAADPRGGLGANIILMARKPIESIDAAPELTALRQRVRLIARIAPLQAPETAEYLRFRLEKAGGIWDDVFEPDAVAWIHRYSGGIIRVIDNLTETCLSLAAVRQEPQVSVGLIQEVAAGMPLLTADQTPSPAADTASTRSAPVCVPFVASSGADDVAAQASPAAPAETSADAGGRSASAGDRTADRGNAAEDADDATAQAGIVLVVGRSGQPATGDDPAPEIPVLEDVVESAIPGRVGPAGAQAEATLSGEDREQIQWLDALADSALLDDIEASPGDSTSERDERAKPSGSAPERSAGDGSEDRQPDEDATAMTTGTAGGIG